MPDDPLQAIKAATLSGHKIEAIKIYREVFGVGLAEAKSAVEHLEVALQNGGDVPMPATTAATLASSLPLPADVLAQIQACLFDGQKIAAIKLLRDCHTSGKLPGRALGLAEAKNEIDRMEADLRLRSPGSFTAPPNTGAMGCAVLLVLLAGLAYGIWRLMH